VYISAYDLVKTVKEADDLFGFDKLPIF